jgi:hypothetical protein
LVYWYRFGPLVYWYQFGPLVYLLQETLKLSCFPNFY